MSGVKDAVVGQIDSERLVVMFAPASPHIGDAEWALTLAKVRWLRNRLNEHSKAAAIHMIENLQNQLDINEPAPPMPGEWRRGR